MDDGQDRRPSIRGEASIYLGGISAIIETAVGSTMPIANLENGCAMFWEGSTQDCKSPYLETFYVK